MIRSVKHYFGSSLNSGKELILRQFLQEYRTAIQSYIDYLWTAEIYYPNSDNLQFCISKDLLHTPAFLDYQSVKFTTALSARALSSATNQALGIVRGRVAIRNKLLFIIRKRKEENLPTEIWEKKLLRRQCVLTKPELKEDFSAELSSKNIDHQDCQGYFNLFVRLSSSGLSHLKLPVKLHKQDKKWISAGGKKLTGILLNKSGIQVRYEVPEPKKKRAGKTVGADTGKKTVITLSDGSITPKQDRHGHSLDSILLSLSRKKKGSKGFSRTATHRKNFINWSVNQLNLQDIREIRLEEIDNLFFMNRTSRLMSGFTNTLIEQKIQRLAEETGVLISLQPSIYKSQRCSGCGLVRKANRKGKEYCCSSCGLKIDSDLNAAINNEKDIPAVPFALRQQELNRGGFFWKEEGFTDLAGQELRVPDISKK